VEILLWLVPAAAVTVVTMLWVGWLGRERRGDVDPQVAVRRLAAALEREKPRRPVKRYVVPRPAGDRSTGVAVRRREETRRRAS
jgi:hypothetical protein